MGCDIHLYAEIKQDGKWVSADKWSADPWDDGDAQCVEIKWNDRLYNGRNYALFGVLAGVRDRSQLLISRPRGLPKDISLEVRKRSDDYGSDGHSHSWLTLAELLAYDWSECERIEGWRQALSKLQKLGDPNAVRIVFFFDN